MADVTPPDRTLRQAVAHLLAKYFVYHLEAELQKPDEVLCQFRPGEPVRKWTQECIQQVRREFAIGDDEKLPAHNLFKTWRSRNGAPASYENTSFVDYNRGFVLRLLDLRDGSSETQQTHYEAMREAFSNFDYEKQGYTVAFFLESESTMRELLRKAVREDLPEWAARGDELVLEQSRSYQAAIFHYFDDLLRTALTDRERLLHEILPRQVATELQRNGFVAPVYFPDAAVLFTDFEAFTRHTEHLQPAEVIQRLDTYFTEFDRISDAHGLEKIKTIGDSYMAVAGVPELHNDPVRAACDAALDILEASKRLSTEAGREGWNIRIGIHAGPLVAGVIGKRKFSYDVWGATVNFASRMESSGEPGRINVSPEVHARVEAHYDWEPRGPQPVKRLGDVEMYFLLGKKA